MPSRRRFVASAAAGAVAALAGCTGDDANDAATSTTTATGVASTAFDWSAGIDSNRMPDDDPIVSFDAPDGVSVEGAFRYGSSSCDRIALDDVALADGTLRVRVVSTSVRDEPTTCTDDLAAGDYRVTVTLDGGLPERVAVTEAPAQADEQTYTATPD